MADEVSQGSKGAIEDNPWYILATLYGQPADLNDNELHAKNRVMWNRYMASHIDEKLKDYLIKRKSHSTEELTPFAEYELRNVEATFAERSKNKVLYSELQDSAPDFSNVIFDRPFLTIGFIFPDGAPFFDSTFSQHVSFKDAVFFHLADFSDATFSAWVGFERTTFWMAEFNDVKFCKHTEFTGSTFRDLVSFSHTTFLDVVDFNGASFMDIADFNNITFCSETDFKETVFHGFVRFVNTTFVGETDFTRASFNFEPPMFFNAKLHQGTVWRDVSWPIPSRDDDIDPGRFVDAYACLKLEMDRLKKHEDELDFFALEMQSRRWLVSFWHSILIWLYGLFCDYGRNYSRPLASLAITVIAGAIPFWWYFSVSTPPIFAHAVPTLSSVQALGLSFANTFNVLGIRKDFVDPEIIGTFPGWMKALAVTQTIIGVVMLFLFSLALRNRFRMR